MEYEFEPKEWVLCRDGDKEEWRLDIFSRKSVDDGDYICVGMRWNYCIPYDGNEHLLGTKDKPTEWEVGDKVEVYEVWSKKWYDGKIVGINAAKMKDDGLGFKVESECFDRSDGWKWCKADQLRKPGAEETPWRPKAGEAVEALVDNKWRDAVLITDDHDDCIPYCIRFDNGTTMWCKACQIRKPAEKKGPDEPYKFGDKVQCREDGEWMDGLFIMDDKSGFKPYLIYIKEKNDTNYFEKEDIRRA